MLLEVWMNSSLVQCDVPFVTSQRFPQNRRERVPLLRPRSPQSWRSLLSGEPLNKQTFAIVSGATRRLLLLP